MPRKKISEYRAKAILSEELGQPYAGVSIDAFENWRRALEKLPKSKRYVVKVDQGVKGRFKKGLVYLNKPAAQVPASVQTLIKKGFRYIVVEEYQPHKQEAELYLSMERTRAGIVVSYSDLGGVDIESNAGSVKKEFLTPASATKLDRALGLPHGTIAKLGSSFDSNFMALLEINPLLVEKGAVGLLDTAVEVDDTAAPFVSERWTSEDFRELSTKTPEEIVVEELAATSQASFSLKVLNSNGGVFLLLSGGGASVTLADEVFNLGYGSALANYGEYSGNPTEEETYIYTKQLISLMLKSRAPRKVLIIGGGVANFTDVKKTFLGVMHALKDYKAKLKSQHIKVFVRRGGPNEAQGLAAMEALLIKEGLHGQVSGPEIPLSSIVRPAVATLGQKGGPK